MHEQLRRKYSACISKAGCGVRCFAYDASFSGRMATMREGASGRRQPRGGRLAPRAGPSCGLRGQATAEARGASFTPPLWRIIPPPLTSMVRRATRWDGQHAGAARARAGVLGAGCRRSGWSSWARWRRMDGSRPGLNPMCRLIPRTCRPGCATGARRKRPTASSTTPSPRAGSTNGQGCARSTGRTNGGPSDHCRLLIEVDTG